MRMPDSTPVQEALEYAQQPYQRPRGKPKSTWMSLILKQLSTEHFLTWEKANVLAQDRVAWRNLCEYYNHVNYILRIYRCFIMMT